MIQRSSSRPQLLLEGRSISPGAADATSSPWALHRMTGVAEVVIGVSGIDQRTMEVIHGLTS